MNASSRPRFSDPSHQSQSHPKPSGSAHLLQDDDSVFADQDCALAALQPSMSSRASHLTSSQTPAAEKAAALDRVSGPFVGSVIAETEAERDAESDPEPLSSTERTARVGNESPERRNQCLGQWLGSPPPQQPEQVSLPAPWISAPNDITIEGKDTRSRQTRGVLGSAFGPPTRQRRATSTGQDAFKKLQKAFPSLAMPTHMLPSLPTSLLSTFTGDQKHGQSNNAKPADDLSGPSAALVQQVRAPESQNSSSPARGFRAPPEASRPPMLRRVTSDDSILYHSLSRASSLGDDGRFQDVRAMVNIRLMALKDSLPDVPNFRMPSLTRLQAASRIPSISLNGLFSSSADPGTTTDRDLPGTAGGTAATRGNASTALDRVLEQLTGDIVVLGGYRGSVLRSAEPPHQQLWAPVKLGFNMRKANLEMGLEDEDEETMEQRIIPSGMLKHTGPIDISRKLFKRLRSCDNVRSGKLRVWDYGYDWRLSPALSSRRLQQFLAGLPSNQPGVAPESRGALVIAHSLGGLITRHAVNQRPDLFAGVLYAGVPQRCINILGPFRNGDVVLFNEKLLTAQVNFSIRTSFVLLPDDGFCFVDKETGQMYPVDFFNADDWVKWRLSPCVAPALSPYSRDKPQPSSPLSSLFPNALLKGGRSDKKPSESSDSTHNSHAERKAVQPGVDDAVVHRDGGVAPRPGTGPRSSSSPPPPSPARADSLSSAPDHDRYMAYLRRTLAATRRFRAELAHSPAHESSNAYPPHAVLYGKSIPTVYAAQVNGRDAIRCSDAYDDLLFRAGDGVVLAREAMPPHGYALVRGGRVSTERGHLTMLGDLPAVGQALEALVWGRRKGIGLGTRGGRGLLE